MQELFIPLNVDVNEIVEKLSSMGATSIRLLNEQFRLSLLKEAESYTFKLEDEVVGSGDRIVRQQVQSFDSFCVDSNFILLKRTFQLLLEQWFRGWVAYPCKTRLNLNSMSLQRYEKDSIGITPHRDGLRYINLVCIFIIGGKGRFFVCSDRSGTNAKEIRASPGSVILMRAPGFLGSKERPFHFVTDIREARYACGLRQRRSLSSYET